MIDVIVSGGLNLTVEDTGDIINVTVELAPSIAVEVVVGVPTKESIVGLSKDDSPEFADVVIPEIAEESSYTASAWAWLTGLFGTVTGSVKAMLVGLVESVASLDERVGELEDNVVVDITTEEDVSSIVVLSDKHGNPLNLSGNIIITRSTTRGNNSHTNINTIFINDINSDVFYNSYGAVAQYYGINYRGGNLFSISLFNLFINDGIVAWSTITAGASITPSVIGSTNNQYGFSIPDVVDIQYINKLEFKDSLGAALIPKGTRIIIEKA